MNKTIEKKKTDDFLFYDIFPMSLTAFYFKTCSIRNADPEDTPTE